MRTLIAAGLVLGLAAWPPPRTRSPTRPARGSGRPSGRAEAGEVLKLKLGRDKAHRHDHAGRRQGKATEVKIEDGKYKDGEVTFTVTREFNDQKFVTKYAAKVDGDTMKGTATSDGREGEQAGVRGQAGQGQGLM